VCSSDLDDFVNRPLTPEDYHGFVVELEAIKKAREEVDEWFAQKGGRQ